MLEYVGKYKDYRLWINSENKKRPYQLYKGPVIDDKLVGSYSSIDNLLKKHPEFRKQPLKVDDKVKLRKDALLRHSASVPARAGYTPKQFAWNKTLNSLKGKTGTITRIFENSNQVVVKYPSTTIGIESTELVKV